jgi:hypothetical protein
MQTRLRAETFEPPYPAHTTIFPEDWPDYVMSQIAVQAAPGGDPSVLMAELDAALAEAPAPLHYERCRGTDIAGYRNEVTLAYWRSRPDFEAWLENPAVDAFLAQPLSGPLGLWRESIVAPIGNVDPNGMLPRHEWGIGRHLTQAWERYHSYYGSMRDRMANGRLPEIEGTDTKLVALPAVESLGRRLRIIPPHNLCFIRNISGWSSAKPHEQRAFENEVIPNYLRGVAWLRDNPEAASCISTLACETVAMPHPNGLQAETLAWFTSLAALEAWTHHHATHAAIHRSVFEFAQTYGFDIQMNLGHEVVDVPREGLSAEYNNCHPNTGLLAFLASGPA